MWAMGVLYGLLTALAFGSGDFAVTQAARTVRNLDWFELQSVRGQIADGAIAHWQVTVKLGFRLET